MAINVDPSDRTIENYQTILRKMITNDEACPSPTCDLTMLGHLMQEIPPHQSALVKELDPEFVDTRGPVVEARRT